MHAPLSGIRVLDLTNVLSGPFACAQLAFQGAEVIKVEVPGRGDLARQLGADPDLNAAGMGVSFLAQNAGKASVTVNLKDPRGKEVLRRLAATADVLVENFRPGVMERLDLGAASLRAANPRLIYCAISGFGQDGPMRGLPAYDQIVQGLAGVMSVTGDAGTGPLRTGFPIADTIGGLTAAMAINAALAGRARTGEGSVIDVSMLESTLAAMGWVVSNFLVAGKAPVPMGNDNFTAAPSGVFRTATGPVNIAANKQEQFEALCEVLDLPGLARDPRFARRQDRLDNRAALSRALEEATTGRDASDLVADLNAAGVPAGPVLTVPEALDLPQVRGRGFVRDHGAAPGVDRPVRGAGTGYRLDGAAPAVDRPPPALGADTDAVLAELGYARAEIAALREAGVI